MIGAAKKISEAGANLDKFCRQVAEQVAVCIHVIYVCAFHSLLTL